MTDTSSSALYIGVTNDLPRRCCEHQQKNVKGFSSRYNTIRLAYYEQTSDILAAIQREKQLKGWRRKKKEDLIEKMNPEWKDLSQNL